MPMNMHNVCQYHWMCHQDSVSGLQWHVLHSISSNKNGFLFFLELYFFNWREANLLWTLLHDRCHQEQTIAMWRLNSLHHSSSVAACTLSKVESILSNTRLIYNGSYITVAKQKYSIQNLTIPRMLYDKIQVWDSCNWHGK